MSSVTPAEASRARRLSRTAHTSLPTSLLAVGDDVALAGVGLVPVGEVAGAVALFEPETFVSAGAMAGAQAVTYTSVERSPWHGPGNEARILTSGILTSQQRLLDEARGLGADGVVGVRVGMRPDVTSRVWRFEATGTAVRSTGRTRAATPFTTDLSGSQVASALRSGWQPVTFLAVPVHAVRANDAASTAQVRRRAANAEIDAYTDLVTTCRHAAREEFARLARATGADGAVLTSLDLEFESGYVSRARVLVRGTALTRFRVAEQPPGLTVMPLSPSLSASPPGERR